MSRVEQFTLDLGDGTPAVVAFDSKTFKPPKEASKPIRHFGGKTFDAQLDGERLARQYDQVWTLMVDGQWRTLAHIALLVDAPQASVSARLRDFRKLANGGHIVASKRVAGTSGLHIYRLIRRPAP